MTPELRIYDALKAESTLTALVSDRITPMRRGQAKPLPAVTYQRISNIPSASLDGNVANLDHARVQIDLWASDLAGLQALGAAVYKALGTLSGIIEQDLDDYDDDLPVMRRTIDFSFWNQPVQPTL